jgi:ketosteroid isomerase-like protein
MSRRLVLLAVTLFALASCSTPPAMTPEPGSPNAHIASAESTLTRFSNALSTADSATVIALAGEHFALIEDGHAYSAEGLVPALRSALAGGHMERTIGELHTHVKGRIVWTHYPVTVTLDAGQGPQKSERIETAVLERNENESWSVLLMSSMPAASGKK